jgi:hypothetical protein
MTDPLERLIGEHLAGRAGSLSPTRDLHRPEAGQIYRYLNEELSGVELTAFLEALKKDVQLQETVLKARELLLNEHEAESQAVPAPWLKSVLAMKRPPARGAVCPHCGKTITPFKTPPRSRRWKNLFWVSGMILAFCLSFFLRRYFMQCLAVSVLCGVKAVVEMRALKTQVLIYKALSDGDPGQQHRLQPHAPRL